MDDSMLPKNTTYKILICTLLTVLCSSVMAQDGISRITQSTVNNYARVEGINGRTVTLDAIGVSMFIPENLPDTVLLIQMTGVSKEGNSVNNAGRYEFHIVTGVNGQNVTLNSEIGTNTFNPTTEIVQMIRVPSYKNAMIETTLSCKPWDWQEGTGGVLALMVDETLTFKADIDVSGRGFKGGKAYTTEYNGPLCSFDAEDLDYLYAGYKGEGAVTKSYFEDNPTGYGNTFNGGGGGNGKWSGGGGGANGGNGGAGESQACGAPGSSDSKPQKIYGSAIKYTDWQESGQFRRVFMGGGGGAGTGIGTAGGNGGGIVIIIAQNLHFESNTAIKANGVSVETELPKEAGAGGGGGGGSILLSVKNYGKLKVEIMGGKGGSVDRLDNSGNYSKGVGGGGSGGILFTSATLKDSWYNSVDSLKKNGGDDGLIRTPPGVICYKDYSTPGDPGKFFDDFHVQLRGFLHNYIITPNISVCNGVSTTIEASEPKGGTGFYMYNWQFSSNSNIWEPLNNITTPDLISSFTDNIYIRRMVSSGVAPADVVDYSLPVFISVYKAISNEIAPNDTTLCWKESLLIRGNTPAEEEGGGGHTYRWQVITDHTEAIETSTPTRMVSLRASGDQTIRRQVTSSKGCESGWSASVLHIQPEIKNNTITLSEQNICENEAGLITGAVPTGGVAGQYEYEWRVTSFDRQITDATNLKDYHPYFNANPHKEWDLDSFRECYYQRYVTSGKCESLSDEVMVRFYRQSSPSNITTTDKLDDDALQFLFSEKLYATAPQTGKGMWTSDNEKLSFDPPDEPVASVDNLQFGVNTIYWTVSNGACVSPADLLTIEVKDVVVPTGFSPGNDSFNDCFRVIGGENATSGELLIFDRYNNVVFESASFKGSSNLDDCSGWWDGRNKSGNELPSGVYFYQITLNGKYVYKGYVVLKRQ